MELRSSSWDSASEHHDDSPDIDNSATTTASRTSFPMGEV